MPPQQTNITSETGRDAARLELPVAWAQDDATALNASWPSTLSERASTGLPAQAILACVSGAAPTRELESRLVLPE